MQIFLNVFQDPSEVDGENESELLPSGWNSERGVYSLFYTDSEHRTIYLLKLVSCEDEILVHLMVRSPFVFVHL